MANESKAKRNRNAAQGTGAHTPKPGEKSPVSTTGGRSRGAASKATETPFTMDDAKKYWVGVPALSIEVRQAGTQWTERVEGIIGNKEHGAGALAFFAVCQEATNARRQHMADFDDDAEGGRAAFRKVWATFAPAAKLHIMRDGKVVPEYPRSMAQAVQALMETHAGFDPSKVSDPHRLRVVKSATDAMRYAATGFAKEMKYELPKLRPVTPKDSAKVQNDRIMLKAADDSESILPASAVSTADVLVRIYGTDGIRVLVLNVLAHFNADIREEIMADVDALPKTSIEAREIIKAHETAAAKKGAVRAVQEAMGRAS